ncbi:MAG TPA: 16S rRNA (guanine(527)-N(7))-methyltransferase RsmG [Rudaea sp.]|nr:16S rRNA (guanine(527)-N(7))-methyltransferase RsmG [Rudaea sp.]
MTQSSVHASRHTRLAAGMAALGLPAADATIEKLLDYVALLERWNATYNLTAVRDPDEMITKHVLDSLAVERYVQGSTLVDVGSGAGLPGIPLAVLAPARTHVLIDSNGKKTRFLREAVRALALPNVRVEQSRVEDARGQYDTVTARAFAALGDMLELGGHLLAPSGVWIALKGRLDRDEIAELPAGFRIGEVHALSVPGLDAPRHAVLVRREHAAARDEAA